MADFFFFTEPNKLQDQTSEQAFGAIDENKYRLGNMFTATANSKAFAVTSGNVLVQAIDSNTVTLVLKPEEQPNLDFPKIDYIRYKGATNTSIIDSNNDGAAIRTNSDLTKTKWRVLHNKSVCSLIYIVYKSYRLEFTLFKLHCLQKL